MVLVHLLLELFDLLLRLGLLRLLWLRSRLYRICFATI